MNNNEEGYFWVQKRKLCAWNSLSLFRDCAWRNRPSFKFFIYFIQNRIQPPNNLAYDSMQNTFDFKVTALTLVLVKE